MKDITRPLPSVLNENKVQPRMKTLQTDVANDAPPTIDVLWYDVADSKNN